MMCEWVQGIAENESQEKQNPDLCACGSSAAASRSLLVRLLLPLLFVSRLTDLCLSPVTPAIVTQPIRTLALTQTVCDDCPLTQSHAANTNGHFHAHVYAIQFKHMGFFFSNFVFFLVRNHRSK